MNTSGDSGSLTDDDDNRRVALSEGISVYPNPVEDELHVIGPIEKEDTFAVIDLSGKCRLSVIATSAGDLSFDVSRLSRGVYLLLYSKKDKIMTVKFEKR